MKKVIVLLIAIFAIYDANSQGCLPFGYSFTTQQQIDNFQANYPGCTEIEGEVEISGESITNLNGLNVVNSIGGGLFIESNNSLNSLDGLENLDSIGGYLNIIYNHSLTSIAGLENLTSIGEYLQIFGNSSLTNLSGLESLISIGGSFRINNTILTSLSGLEGLTSIGGNLEIEYSQALTDLSGLENLTYIGGQLLITSNYYLNSLSGLDSLTTIGGGLPIYDNDSLSSLSGLKSLISLGGDLDIHYNNALKSLSGLENLTSIGGGLEIYDNGTLMSLSGLDNIDAGSILTLTIVYNNFLTICDVNSICDYLSAPNGTIDIFDNGAGCDSPDEVKEACPNAVEEIKTGIVIIIVTPNPAKDKINISSPLITGNTNLSVFNVNGEKVIEMQLTDNETQLDISTLPRGVYFVRLQNEKMVEVGKMVKE